MKQNEAIYVQYGCGQSCPDGWVNFDASPSLRLQRLPFIGIIFQRHDNVFPKNVRFGDIVRGLPVPDGAVQGVYASHVLEHLCYVDFWTALNRTFRMLRPGGIFRLIVPDLKARAQIYIERNLHGDFEANSWFMRNSHLGLEDRPSGLEALARATFGHSAHLWMWDEKSLSAALEKVGFAYVRRCSFGDCEDTKFRLVEDPARFYDHQTGVHECSIQAIKPGTPSPGSR